MAGEIAKEILSQINATDFWARARWGVKEMYHSEDTLHMVLGRGRGKVMVKLEPCDTYTVTFGRVRRGSFEWVELGKASDIYFDNLVEVIDGMLSK
jgi:hypothetical protein